MLNEGIQIHNFISISDSGTVINYGSGSDFLMSYGSGSGSGSTRQKVTVPTVPVPVPQHCSFQNTKLGEKIMIVIFSESFGIEMPISYFVFCVLYFCDLNFNLHFFYPGAISREISRISFSFLGQNRCGILTVL